MKNRETIMRRLEHIESNMSKLNFILKRQGSREEFEEVIINTQELIGETISFIQQEPISDNELNKF